MVPLPSEEKNQTWKLEKCTSLSIVEVGGKLLHLRGKIQLWFELHCQLPSFTFIPK